MQDVCFILTGHVVSVWCFLFLFLLMVSLHAFISLLQSGSVVFPSCHPHWTCCLSMVLPLSLSSVGRVTSWGVRGSGDRWRVASRGGDHWRVTSTIIGQQMFTEQ